MNSKINLSLFLGLFSLLVIPYYLTPSPTGIGTHEQLGLPPCPLYFLFNIKCPTCGLTTSFTHMAHGHFQKALECHLMGPLFYVMTIAMAGLFFVASFKPTILNHFLVSRKIRFMIDVILTSWILAWVVNLLH